MNGGLEREIRTRAYERWQQEGRPEGRDKEHWLAAERELTIGNPGQTSADAPSVDQEPPSRTPDARRAKRPSTPAKPRKAR